MPKVLKLAGTAFAPSQYLQEGLSLSISSASRFTVIQLICPVHPNQHGQPSPHGYAWLRWKLKKTMQMDSVL